MNPPIGGGLQTQSDQNSLWTDNILLCINLNFAHVLNDKAVIDLLISYYHPFFKNILMIYDSQQDLNTSNVPGFVSAMHCNSSKGWFQQKCIQRCIQQGNDKTEGYLYISDDMFINITKMAELSRSKVWFLKNHKTSFSAIQKGIDNGKGWQWWRPPFNNAIKLQNMINSLPTKWKVLAGFPAVATSDIIYVPQTLVPHISPVLEHIISQGDLFCEIATALAVNIASPDFVPLTSGYLWATDRNSKEIERKSKNSHFIHPIKLTSNENKALWTKYMEKQLIFLVK